MHLDYQKWRAIHPVFIAFHGGNFMFIRGRIERVFFSL